MGKKGVKSLLWTCCFRLRSRRKQRGKMVRAMSHMEWGWPPCAAHQSWPYKVLFPFIIPCLTGSSASCLTGFLGVCKNPKPILVFGAKCCYSFPNYFSLFSFAFGKVILIWTLSWGSSLLTSHNGGRPHLKSCVWVTHLRPKLSA